jgi:hypothetical protein
MTVTASIPGDLWRDIVEHDRQYLFLVLVGFVASFGFIRLSTRLMRSPRVPWWPGSVVSEGGVHVHHLVFGIVTMMVSGVASFALSDVGLWYELCAAAFGIGLGLTIDEFALWLYLDDVYWSKQGRSSIDATVLVAALMGLVLIGTVPFNVTTSSIDQLVATLAATAVQLTLVTLCFAKQRLVHGIVGLLIPVLALYGAVRLGKPTSPWARRRYGTGNPTKQTRAEQRFRPDRRTERFKDRLRDLVGGVTEEEHQARLAARRPAPRDTQP